MTANGDPTRILGQYESYPYPSLPEDNKRYSELANLVRLFEMECGYTFSNKRILDVGTGTGLRLLELASTYPNNTYLGIDFSEPSIQYAEIAKKSYDDSSVSFRAMDAAQLSTQEFGQYDFIFCMGVLHHLENPRELLTTLSRLTTKAGAIFFYVYGEYGSSERMRRKRFLNHFHSEDATQAKIATAKTMGFTDFPYGWELRNQQDMDAMIVDAYINNYEALYTLEKIDDIIPHDEFSTWIPFGFALDKNGVLVESRLSNDNRLPLPRATPQKFLTSSVLQKTYEALPKHQQLLLLEDWFQPSGYTVLLHDGDFLNQLGNPRRLAENTWG